MDMETVIAVCSTCNESLSGKGECLACLLRAGLEEAIEEAAPLESLVFGDFEIARREDGSFWELGSGAMGVTYRARDKVLHRTVALKVIEAPLARGDSRAVRERFLREARAAAALKHPNVAGIFQFGASPETDRCYYAMEFVEGETLEALVRRDGPLKVDLALEIAIQVTRALMGAAAQGLIHRDLKPGNIMIVPNDFLRQGVVAKVIDFGLAKSTLDGAGERDITRGGFVGTPIFASPEQLGGAAVDARSDIYSLGVTLWYALTGEVPYPGKTIEEIRNSQANVALPTRQLVSRNVPASLIALLHCTLAVDAMKRPASPRELLTALEGCQARLNGPDEATPHWFNQRTVAFFVAVVIIIGGLFAFLFPRNKAMPSAAVSEKSIAVMPFENLDKDEANAFLAAGIQDEIISNLAYIADLKVISRASVIRYQKGTRPNLREIARSLGVANIVEGSVQRTGNRVRITAQLIDARSDSHRWTETYDREVADLFAIQDEIAEQIAHRLQATIAPQEQALIAEKPTSDLIAYGLYERARNLQVTNMADQEKRIGLLQGAIRRDPKFLLAYCLLAKTYANMSAWENFDSNNNQDTSVAKAREAIDIALRLRPDRGEPHLIDAYYYFLTLQFLEARRELDAALRLLPNDPEAIFLDARLDRHENRWDAALRKAQRASDLDPHNQFFISWTADTYGLLRRYPEGEEFVNGAIAKNSAKAEHFDREFAKFKLGEGDLAGALAHLRHLSDGERLGLKFQTLLFAKDYDAALRAVATAPPEWVESEFWGKSPNSLAEAVVFLVRGEPEKADPIFRLLREQMDRHSSPAHRNEWYYKACSRLDAALGRKEEAIREAREALDMHPVERDPINGGAIWINLAEVYAMTGETDLAIEQLDGLSRIPSDINYGGLRFDPTWDSLRGDPRFEKIVASLEPKKIDK